ncbi:UNVERIFIED_ORG: integrase [Rhizobium esperanzae]
MASVRRRVEPSTGKVFYQADWSVYDSKGKRHRKTKAFSKQSAAREYAAKMELQNEKRAVSDPTKLTFEEFRERIMEHWRSKPKLASTTIVAYDRNLNTLSRELGSLRMDRITPWHIDKAFAALRVSGGVSRKGPRNSKDKGTRPLSEQTLLHLHRSGSAAFKQAHRWGIVTENPFTMVDAPSPDRRPISVMSEEEARRVFAEAVKASESGKWPGYDLLVAILLTCGLRRSEVLGLAFDAVDMETGDIAIRRTVVAAKDGAPIMREDKAKTKGSLRTVRLPAELLPMLKRHKATIGAMALEWGKGYQREPLLLFPAFGGGPLKPGMLTTRMREFQRLAKVTGVMPTHGYRHGMATALVASGLDVRAVADRLGHGTVAFTLSRYVHKSPGRDQIAADTMGAQFKAISGLERAEKSP